MFTTTEPLRRNFCFVIMPFRDEFDAIYEKVKEVAVLQHAMVCERGDDIYSAGIIIEEVWAKICEAHLVIAEATGKNPNVFYEMGLAHAVGKDVIILTQQVDDIPFDLRHRRVISYSSTRLDVLAVKLSKTINTPEVEATENHGMDRHGSGAFESWPFITE
jgi:hypothetical protein